MYYGWILLIYTHPDDVLDLILDQEGVEVDPIDRMEGDTPLHKAVRYVNERAASDWESSASLVDLLLDAGSDPRSVMLTKGTPFYCHCGLCICTVLQ